MTDPTDDHLDAILEDALTTEPLRTATVRARILERLAEPLDASPDPWNRFLSWLAGGPLLRPAVVALVPLALGFALATALPHPGGANGDTLEAADFLAFVSIEDFADE